jgi:methionyl-tRNA formyltransferase
MKKIILCGYNWSGCKALELLLKKKYKVFVFTHTSKYFESDLEYFCKNKKINHSLEKISKKNLPFKPDLIISISYRYKIPGDVLSFSKYKGFNLHPSLLPKYRGCSSLTWAMLNGEKKCGFTYHYMDENFDTGNIIFQKSINIENYDLQITLFYRVMFESLKYFEKALKLALNNKKGKKQKGKKSYYKRGAPHNGEINPNWSRIKKESFIKAMIFPPRPLAKYKSKFIKKISQLN